MHNTSNRGLHFWTIQRYATLAKIFSREWSWDHDSPLRLTTNDEGRQSSALVVKRRMTTKSKSAYVEFVDIYLIILCSVSPLSMMGVSGVVSDINQYISLSINQNAMVLSPTRAWSCDSAYAMVFSPWRRFIRVHTISHMRQSSSFFSFRIWDNYVHYHKFLQVQSLKCNVTDVNWKNHVQAERQVR